MEYLIDKLSQEELNKTKAYYYKYSIKELKDKNDIVPIDTFLLNWNNSKSTLYKALGNNFIYKIPYSYAQSRENIEKRLCHFLSSDKAYAFVDPYTNLLDKYEQKYNLTHKIWASLCELYKKDSLINNQVKLEVILDFIPNKKAVKICAGMKIFRALTKVLTYLDAPKELFDNLEDFRINLSMITNEKIIKGNLCLSILPLDYMTMSDNNSNWSSCMSWQDGCYRVGAYEMMNSNNVICCYLESNSNIMQIDDNFSCNNKKWRQLLYVNKDIIVSGKAYPYQNKELSFKLLDIMKQLVKDNCGWTYKYGIENYEDMRFIDSGWDIQNEKGERGKINPKKIYFTNKVMYNDMMNDHSTEYYCYRNPISHSKTINISGKVNCICCNGTLLYEDEEYYDDWNDRYGPSDRLYCEDCKEEYTCNVCEEFIGKNNGYILNNRYLCADCAKNTKICPGCSGYILLEDYIPSLYYIKDENKEYNVIDDFYDDIGAEKNIHKICMCSYCYKEISNSIQAKHIKTTYGFNRSVNVVDKITKDWTSFYEENIKFIDFSKIL